MGKSFVEDIIREAENTKRTALMKMAVAVSARVIELFPSLLEVQPGITHVVTGMGSWSFMGKGVAIDDEGSGGTTYEIDAVNVEYAAKEESTLTVPLNDAIKEIVPLMDELVEVGGLNCSTIQGGIGPDGVIFYFDDTQPDIHKGPFGTPSRAYIEGLDYFKALADAGIPSVFLPVTKYR